MSNKWIGVRHDIEELISSDEADQVTPLMTKIYYRLLVAPSDWWDSREALRVRGRTRDGVSTTAWSELVNWLLVTPEEASEALRWLDEKKIINYRPHKSGREIEITFEGLYFPE
jgi:hypothetical protein